MLGHGIQERKDREDRQAKRFLCELCGLCVPRRNSGEQFFSRDDV
jgi:hypothetical protein